jgi:PAS domain S-box-containing protein
VARLLRFPLDWVRELVENRTWGKLIRNGLGLAQHPHTGEPEITETVEKLASAVGDYTPASGLISGEGDLQSTDSIHRVQVSQIVSAIPLFLLFHASAAVCIFSLTAAVANPLFVGLWAGAVFLVGLALAAVFIFWRRNHWHQRPERVLRGLEFVCLFLGFVWATPVAAALYMDQGKLLFPIIGLALAVLGIASTSLMRVPTGAIIFVAMVSATVASALYRSVDDYNFLATMVCVIYGLVLVGITINSHLDFLRRSHAEIEVQRQNEVVKLLLNDFERDAQDWLWETDAEGRLTYFSPRFAEVLNEKPQFLQLRPLRNIFADHALNEDWRKLDHAMADEEVISNLVLSLRVANKSVVWQITARPLRDGRGKFAGYRGVSRDITAASEAKSRIELAMDTSERASSAKTQFLAVMSHELRTPINSIVGFAELLSREKNDNLQQKTRVEFAETILESANQLQDLVNNILDTTRMERGTMQLTEQDVDAAELVEISIKQCRSQAERGNISIVGRLTDAVLLHGDVNRLKQVMVNLLINAIKFSPANGIINVEMQKGREGQFVLAIKDAGIGIAAQDLERMFEPFEQADGNLGRRFSGAGLGLPISRRIARMHDGDVTLESVPGAGTTAHLVLPKRRVTWSSVLPSDVQNVA